MRRPTLARRPASTRRAGAAEGRIRPLTPGRGLASNGDVTRSRGASAYLFASLALALSFASALVAGAARANDGDVFGLGSEAIARGGAMTAVATGWDATFYNPAGLALHGRREITVGYFRILPDLEIHLSSETRHPRIENPDAAIVGATLPLGSRVGLGIGAVVLPTTIIRVISHSPDVPFISWFDNRTQRLALFPAVGVRPLDWLSLGVGANFLAGLDGLATAGDGPSRAVESSVLQEIFSRVSVHAGVRVDAPHGLSFGVAYRQRFYAPFTERIRTTVGGFPLDIAVDARTLQTPHEIAFGSAWHRGALTLSLDATLLLWSLERSPYVRVDATVSGVHIAPEPLASVYRDTFNVRAGLAVDHRVGRDVTLRYRLGGALEPTYVDDQPGRTSLLDGTKVTLAGGLGVTIAHVLPRPFSLDVHAQAIALASRRFDKVVSTIAEARVNPNVIADEDADLPGDQISNRGFPAVSGGGVVYSLGASVTFEVDR